MSEKYYLTILWLFTVIIIFTNISCLSSKGKQHSVTFNVIDQSDIKMDSVYLTGNIQKLGEWKPDAIKMEKISDSIWSKTILIEEPEKIEFKVNGGLWEYEALDKNKIKYENFKLRVERDTAINIIAYDWKNYKLNGINHLTWKKFLDENSELIIYSGWLYKAGDDYNYKNADYNDSTWQSAETFIMQHIPVNSKDKNIGWYRIHFTTDSAMWNKTVGILIGQFGASEIFYNGKFLFRIGKIGQSNETTINSQNRLWKTLRFDPQNNHVLAIRYANYDVDHQRSAGFSPGFTIQIKNLNAVLREVYQTVRIKSIQQMVFTSVPMILFLLHIFLFFFYRKHKQNLYYAICLLGFAGITYFNFQKYIEINPTIIIIYYQINSLLTYVAVLFGLFTAYSLNYKKFPKRAWVYTIISILLGISTYFDVKNNFIGYLTYAYVIVIMIDVSISFKYRDVKYQKGIWIISTGFGLLGISIIWQILLDYGYIPIFYGINLVILFGMLCLAISMSVFIAYDFSRVSKNLEEQLENVKQLSEKTIEQERLASKMEIEKKIIEVEHERKTKELESARELQLSLLPKELPVTDNLDIACFMATATEVGGDYYDFFLSENNDLTIAIGDATGHGLKAGNMVIVIKGILNILSPKTQLDEILINANAAIKKMNLNMLTMGLALLKISQGEIEFSSAGMPPLLIFRKKTGEVEELLLKAMPLGAFNNFPYTKINSSIVTGDILVLISDGLMERFNPQRETYGIENIKSSLVKCADKSANEIVNNICQESKIWSKDFPIADDITIVVVKIK